MSSSVTADNIARHADPRSLTAYTRENGLWPIEAELLREYAPRFGRMLDIGCGAGRTTGALIQEGYETVGIDLSEPLLAAARRRFPDVRLLRTDATHLSFGDGRFDAVLFSFNGIDYIYPASAREQCFREVWRVLRPGGVFVFSSHNLIGAIFSGGFWYARGYLNALKFAAAQVGNRFWREWYMRYDEFAGPQYHFSAPPSHTVAQLARAGFAVREVRGSTGERNPNRVRMRQPHVYFVAQKALA